jgi:hypothetical protein
MLACRQPTMLQRYVGVAMDDERRCCKDMAAMLPGLARRVLPPHDSVYCQGSIAVLPWHDNDAAKWHNGATISAANYQQQCLQHLVAVL